MRKFQVSVTIRDAGLRVGSKSLIAVQFTEFGEQVCVRERKGALSFRSHTAHRDLRALCLSDTNGTARRPNTLVCRVSNSGLFETLPDFHDSAITKPVMCVRIVVEMGSYLTKRGSFPVQSHNSFLNKRSRKVIARFHRNHSCAV